MAATFGQAREVLNAAVEFHRGLEGFYAQLARRESRERVRMLLEYLSRHEKAFGRALADYSGPEAQKLLDTWMQYEPDDRMLEVPKPKELRADMSVDEVVEIALELDDQLVTFYSWAAELARDSEVRELFQGLAQQAEDEKEKARVNASLIQHM